MSEKRIKTRVFLKHDIAENWSRATFPSVEGELYIYDPDYDESENKGYKYSRFKIGDGVSNVDSLPFATRNDNVHYYSLLSTAARDISNSNWYNELATPDLCKVVVVEKTNRFEVILLSPISETETIEFTKDVDLVLNEELVSTNTTTAINFDSTVNFATITGNSVVKHNVTVNPSAPTSYRMIRSLAKKIVINGGQYAGANECENVSYIALGIGAASGQIMEIYGASISATSNSTSNYLRGIQCGEGVIIKDSSVSTIGAQTVRAILGYCETLEVINCNIHAQTSSMNAKTALGIYTADTNKMLSVKDSVIFADAPGYSLQGTAGVSIGLDLNSNTILYCENCDIFGTHSGVTARNNTYVKGGHYKSNGHGGFYFGSPNCDYYINDATIENVPYNGSYTDLMPANSRLGAFYIGGGSNQNDITAYLDNCEIKGGAANHLFVLRGTDNEQNNTINISNCTVTGDNKIRIDNETLKLNIGEGTNITTDMIDNPASAEFTEKNYRYVGEGNLVYGEDYNTLKDYYDRKFNLLKSNQAIIDVESLPTSSIDTNCFYRLITGTFVQNARVINNWNCNIVEQCPDKGTTFISDITNPESSIITVYYETSTKQVKVYLDQTITAALGMSGEGWGDLELIKPLLEDRFGVTYGGVITSESKNIIKDTYYLLLNATLYTSIDGVWQRVVGKTGSGANAEIFNNSSNIASGESSHAEGYGTTASGMRSHAEGYDTTASGAYSHAEGENTTASNDATHAEGYGTTASGYYAHAEGQDATASGNYSHAEGLSAIAKGTAAHAEGVETEAGHDGTDISGGEHAEGYKTKAKGKHSHAEGWETTASGQGSHAEGYGTISKGSKSHAGGHKTEANGDFSFTHGFYTVADKQDQVVFGRYNASNSNALFMIGDGDSDDNRSNAFYVTKDGAYTKSGKLALDANASTSIKGLVKLTDSTSSTSTTTAATPNSVKTAYDLANSAAKIIDITVLPTSDIKKNSFYRIEKGVFLENQLKLSTWNCILVDTLPTTGTVVTTDMKAVTAYYNKADSTAYGYVNSALATQAGVTAGWYPLANLAPMFGLTFAGVITKISDDPRDGKYRLILEQELYTYDVNGWTLHKSMGQPGTGDSAEIFNHPSNVSSGIASHAEGYLTEATGNYSHSEGLTAKAIGRSTHAEGTETLAQGDASHAEGTRSKALGNESHAEGYEVTASSHFAHAEGYKTLAGYDETYTYADSDVHRGEYAHAEGEGTRAINYAAHAEGKFTIAAGTASHAGGEGSRATGLRSFTHGWYTNAKVDDQFVIGKFNTNNANALFIVGNGTSDTARSNLFEITTNDGVKYNGKHVITANKEANSVTTQSPSTTTGRYYKVQVDKDGQAYVNVPWSSGGSYGYASTTSGGIVKAGSAYSSSANNYGVSVNSSDGKMYVALPTQYSMSYSGGVLTIS